MPSISSGTGSRGFPTARARGAASWRLGRSTARWSSSTTASASSRRATRSAVPVPVVDDGTIPLAMLRRAVSLLREHDVSRGPTSSPFFFETGLGPPITLSNFSCCATPPIIVLLPSWFRWPRSLLPAPWADPRAPRLPCRGVARWRRPLLRPPCFRRARRWRSRVIGRRQARGGRACAEQGDRHRRRARLPIPLAGRARGRRRPSWTTFSELCSSQRSSGGSSRRRVGRLRASTATRLRRHWPSRRRMASP